MKIQLSRFLALIFLVPLMANANTLNLSHEDKKITSPQRGKTMNYVRMQYGNAEHISHSKGKSTKNKPRITRWNYGHFTVYFEKNLVLHTVIH
jgi:hypothetical protein